MNVTCYTYIFNFYLKSAVRFPRHRVWVVVLVGGFGDWD